MLEKVLGPKTDGFYIDIGAYDPHVLSNTKRFYQQGWRGINVEPNKFCHANFMKERPRDLNLNVGIDKERGELEFYVINPPTLSTFSQEEATGHEKRGHQIISRDRVKVITLADLFLDHVKEKQVDFMSIDAEGLDLSVMESNDWNRWRPEVICIEVGDLASRDSIPLRTKQIIEFMNHIRYQPIQTTRLYGSPLNMIFVAKESTR